MVMLMFCAPPCYTTRAQHVLCSILAASAGELFGMCSAGQCEAMRGLERGHDCCAQCSGHWSTHNSKLGKSKTERTYGCFAVAVSSMAALYFLYSPEVL